MSVKRISVSRQMFDRFERRKKWRRFISIVFLTVYSVYLIWRFSIINENSLTLSYLYLIAEFFGLVAGCVIVLKSWNYSHREPVPLIHGLKVDVFVPTYKESIHIIRKTVMAAKAIEYPHQTWILDDGKSAEVENLAKELGVKYISRPANLDAKAGNLNFGLSHSQADFIMVLDSDHIVLPHALNITLGFFADEKVAMVQTPQDYYNTESFQFANCKKTGALWSDQAFFYNISEPCYDAINLASCVGTGVIYRRKALDEIGGIPTATVTEDTHTSIKFNKAGYKTIYLNESIAYGVAAADLSEYYKTRRRWGHGNVHVVLDEKILSYKPMTLHERLCHLTPLFMCLEGWQQLLLLNIPVFTLMFGLAPFEISIFNVLITFFFPFVSYVLLQEIGCGFSRLWTNEIFSMIRWPIYLRISEAWFGRKLKWSTSLKNMKGELNWRLMLPQISVLVLSVISLIVAFIILQKNNFKTGPLFLYFKEKILTFFGLETASYKPVDIYSVLEAGYTLDLVIIAGMWVVYNIFRVIFFLRKVISDSKNSHEFYRFKTPLPITFDDEKKIYGRVLEISEVWIKYSSNAANWNDLRTKKILLHLPAKTLELEIEPQESAEKNVTQAKIIWSSQNDRDELSRAIYSVDWHREFQNRNAYFLTPSDFIIKLFTFKSVIEKKYHEWNVFCYQGRPAVIANFIKKKNLASIVVFEDLKIGTVLEGVLIDKFSTKKMRLKIVEEESLSSLVEKGLDGASARRYSVSF